MSSWFGSSGLGPTLSSLTESVQRASDRVKESIPAEYREGLAKLTLNTDEMISERERFREEAKRRQEAKGRLGQILPWETRDAERGILVDECRDAILELSRNEDTFFGPYEMPLLNVNLEEDEEELEEGEDGGGGGGPNGADQDGGTGGGDQESDRNEGQEERKGETAHRHRTPSPESQEKLEKLQPLPPLLDEFDLDSHVGLIQRLLKEDPQLVLMQATLSGGGARERVFWNNYFVHCAFTRYEAGLSIDEIWSYQQESSSEGGDPAAATSAVGGTEGEAGATAAAGGTTEEETVDFDGSAIPTGAAGVAFQEMGGEGVNDTQAVGAHGDGGPDSAFSDMNAGNDFELVDDDNAADGGAGGPEFDELEAEIARELEGL